MSLGWQIHRDVTWRANIYKSETKGGGVQIFFNFRGFQVPFEFPAHNLGEMIQFKKHMVEMVHLVGESSKMEIRKTYFQGRLGLRYIPVK